MKPFHKKNWMSLLLGASLAPISLYSQQQEIVWGSDLVFGNVITSDGSALLLADFSFELGTFDGFVPTEDNTDQWVGNWKVFDAITPNSPDGGDGFIAGTPPTAFFGSTATLFSDRTSSSDDALPTSLFNAGEQAYVFIRNGDNPVPGTEWLLYTSQSHPSWIFPGGFAEELQWYLDDVDEVIWGAVNGNLIGEGSHTDTSTDFYIRSHGFETTGVPEPSVPLSCSLALSLLIWRRRARKALS